jgi:peptidoglycan hydrolase-like protein with peptidoglycan-binding domain
MIGTGCGGGAFVSVRVDLGLLNSAGLFGNPFSRLRIAADASAVLAAAELDSPLSARAKRVIAAASLWPDKLWFWIGTAALVAALAALPSKNPSVASTGTETDLASLSDPESLPEERPGSGSDLLLSRANIRFCRFQQVRLEAIGPLTNRADLAVFKALANDWNARCARHDYAPAEKRAIDAEAIERREALEGEGRALLGAWRRKIHFGTLAPAGANLTSAPHASASEDQASGMRDLPALITLGVPGKSEAEPVSWPLLRTPSLALLQQAVAARLQRRLSDLGYVNPADGIWGSASRIALLHFKEANGLLRDDVLDAETVTRLFSTSTVNAPRAGWTRPDDAIAAETAYPPPAGARMNPLNRDDAEQIQHRLAELGYYAGHDDGVWGAASRNALRAFKTANHLDGDEEWDAAIEQALSAASAVRAAEPATAVRQKPRTAGLEPKVEPAATHVSIPLPPKRPVQASASAKSRARGAQPALREAPRPPAPIPEASVVLAREP